MTAAERPLVALITAGAYISPDLAAEFGLIPPSFLPVGNRRLYQRQIEALREAARFDRIVMSLPKGFQPSDFDIVALTSAGVELVYVPASTSLGESLTYVILSAGLAHNRLRILHGDTLLLHYPFAEGDTFSAAQTRSFFGWADYTVQDGQARFPQGLPVAEASERMIATGAFAIDDTLDFLRCLALSDSCFITALDLYSVSTPLAPLTAGEWRDFGHLQTYFQSRRLITTEREFNRLEVKGAFFSKSSKDGGKMAAELAWYQTLPKALRLFAPTVYPKTDCETPAGYEIEYLCLTTLSEMFVFGELPASVWRSVFEACNEFLTAAAAATPSGLTQAAPGISHGDKTLARLEEYARHCGLDLDRPWKINGSTTPSLRSIVEILSTRIGTTTEQDLTWIHGDFCFSNILFDFRTQRIKVIDPRGTDFLGRQTQFGDRRYETGKLHHSVVGLYDFIVAGMFRLDEATTYDVTLALPHSNRLDAIKRIFLDLHYNGTTLSELKALEISTLLFFAMLPLHRDCAQRQRALLANGLRLWNIVEKNGAA